MKSNRRYYWIGVTRTVVLRSALLSTSLAFAGPCGTATSLPWAASSSVAGLLPPYTITHSVSGPATTAFTWTRPTFAATTNAVGTASVVFTTYQGVVSASGTFTSGATSFPAEYCKPLVSTIVYHFGELISTLFKSPAAEGSASPIFSLLLPFNDVDGLAPTINLAAFHIGAAGAISDSLGDVGLINVAHGLLGDLAVINGTIRFVLPYSLTIGVPGTSSQSVLFVDTQAFAESVATPEPSTLLLLGSGLLGLGGLVRRRLLHTS